MRLRVSLCVCVCVCVGGGGGGGGRHKAGGGAPLSGEGGGASAPNAPPMGTPLDTITFETNPDTSHCATTLGHCHHCHWTPLWTHLTAIEHPPRTLPLDPLWTTFLVISRGVQLFYGIAHSVPE